MLSDLRDKAREVRNPFRECIRVDLPPAMPGLLWCGSQELAHTPGLKMPASGTMAITFAGSGGEKKDDCHEKLGPFSATSGKQELECMVYSNRRPLAFMSKVDRRVLIELELSLFCNICTQPLKETHSLWRYFQSSIHLRRA